MSKPILLDLYCGAGGATKGYQDAGFDVVGVDIKPQPRYVGEEFVQADALEYLATADLSWFDAIHASPPCQRYSLMTKSWHREDEHPDLVDPTREALKRTGLPWIIENVPGAPLLFPVELCGSAFGLRVRKHRHFETSFPILLVPPCSHHWQDSTPIFEVRNHGPKKTGIAYVFGHGTGKANEHWAPSMGIDWMSRSEMKESIPPAYTRYIGAQLMAHLRAEATA